jgi:hypothetical protein
MKQDHQKGEDENEITHMVALAVAGGFAYLGKTES